jgi:hypothetical protein
MTSLPTNFSVTLLPTPGPSAYTVEWESPVASCQGRAGCLLPISASLTVRAYFIHSTCGRGKTGILPDSAPPRSDGQEHKGLVWDLLLTTHGQWETEDSSFTTTAQRGNRYQHRGPMHCSQYGEAHPRMSGSRVRMDCCFTMMALR